MLPVITAALASLTKLLMPNPGGVGEFVALCLPIAAFFVRYLIGRRRYGSNPHFLWQIGVFVIAILLLALLDTVLILFRFMPVAATREDWLLWFIGHSICLLLMGIAFFPRMHPTFIAPQQS